MKTQSFRARGRYLSVTVFQTEPEAVISWDNCFLPQYTFDFLCVRCRYLNQVLLKFIESVNYFVDFYVKIIFMGTNK